MPRVLAVVAHPDDESFLFGGTLAVHARRGDEVSLLCLTDGQAGRTGGLCTTRELPAVRREEMHRACAVLGIGVPIMPGLPDSALGEYGEDAGIGLVRGTIEELDAEILLTFGPEGASGHEDHKAAWRWTKAAAGNRALYAATFPEQVGPEAPLPLTTVVDIAGLGDLKRRAFLEHRTQLDHLELFDRVQAAFGGTEQYHRVHPAWQKGAPRERGLLGLG
ncbi:MAG: PIG-L deacetylase family protein [Planctomycetota bacterium]|jgi:LmbE family N-acetylglucosaminyl deacetylase